MKKKIWIITIFPDYFKPMLEWGVVGQAIIKHCDFNIINLRDYTFDRYKSIDDNTYGGGPGMVMKADVLQNALVNGVFKHSKNRPHVIYPSPRGWKLCDEKIRSFSRKHLSFKNNQSDSSKDLVFICGRYEGPDERFIKLYVDEEISVGDYILSGGEIATMSILDAAFRFVDGTLGNCMSPEDESFANGLLEAPHYTRPRVFEGLEVPDILLSGHHAKIKEYELEESLRITKEFRPDLLEKYYRGEK